MGPSSTLATPAGTTIGSSTACLVALHPSKPELLAANVGDSGFILLRRVVDGGGGEDSLGIGIGAVGTLDAYAYDDKAASSSTSSTHYVAFR